MKFGFRTPSIKKSLKARTTGRAKRAMKKAVNPLYGKKGMGVINNPEKALYNKVYNKTTTSVFDVKSGNKSNNNSVSVDNNGNVRIKASSVKIKVDGQEINHNQNVLSFLNKYTEEDIEKMNSIEKNELWNNLSTECNTFYNEYYSFLKEMEDTYYSFFKNLNNKDLIKLEKYYNESFEKVEIFLRIEKMKSKINDETFEMVSSKPHFYMINAYKKIKNYEKAIEICKNAIENNYTEFDRYGKYKTFNEMLEYLESKNN